MAFIDVLNIASANLLASYNELKSEYDALKVAFDAYKLTHPDVTPPPPSGTFEYKGLNTVWPNASSTGPRISLTAATSNNVSGLIKGKRFTGTVTVANGTILEDCEIVTSGNSFGVNGDGKTFSVINCRLRSSGGNRYQGILGNCTVINCDISGFEDGVRPLGRDWIVKGCYIHDLTNSSEAHNDGIQAFEGPGIVEQNYIYARDTSAVMVQSFTNSVSNAPPGVIVRHNFLAGGVPLRIESECRGKGCQAYENVIQRGAYNLYYDLSGADVRYDNIDSVIGAII